MTTVSPKYQIINDVFTNGTIFKQKSSWNKITEAYLEIYFDTVNQEEHNDNEQQYSVASIK